MLIPGAVRVTRASVSVGETDDGIFKRDLARTLGGRLEPAFDAEAPTPAQELELAVLVREPFASQGRVAIRYMEVQMRLGGVSRVPGETHHLTAPDLIPDSNANRARLHVRV